MSPRQSALFIALGTSLLLSCSLTRFGDDVCSTNADCRAAFGIGATCGADGLCSSGGAARTPRCTRTFPTDLFTRPLNYRATTVLGVILNEHDPSDVAAENAIELAVKQVNDLGGVDGRLFSVVFCTNQENAVIDTNTEEEATASLGVFLARDLGATAIIGPSTSSQAVALYDAVSPLGTLIISPSATSTALTAMDADTGLFWRTCAPDSEQGAAIADDIDMRGVRTVAVIYEEGPYGTGLADVFTRAYSGTATAFPYPLGNATLRDARAMEVATSASSFGEILFISGTFMEAQQFLRYAALSPTLTSKPIFLTDTAGTSPDFLMDALIAPIFPNIRGSRPALATGPVYEQFKSSYLTRFTDVTEDVFVKYQYAPYAYDAAWLTFAGAVWSVRQSGAINGTDMVDGLRHVSGTGSTVHAYDLLPGMWDGLETDLAAGRDVSVNGASGTLDFDPITDETSGPVEIWSVDSTSTPAVIVVERVVAPQP